jgi:hypothetical protein
VARGGLEIHLFEGVLSHVGDPQIARRVVEGESPGIAESVRPDFSSRAGGVHEGIVGRDAHAPRIALHVEAQQFAQQRP